MSDVFQFLTTDDLRLLAEKAKRVTHLAGEIVLGEGRETRGIYVIRSGRVRVEKRSGKTPYLVTALAPGEVFGEVSFVDGQPASATVIATEPSEIDVLEKADVLSLLVSVPGLASRFYQSVALKLAERLRATTDNLAGL
ncbi:cyclic nucleotide-binding domain-containing protein [Propionivibrio soli]|uniref:cyclic nucleotide-binding domain-containing protein n=1 Tax=Propionivibrio soli TaxID=2976531 RepID=UPI0021E7B3C9|nr:cyclic nucleotide-binding domain-containing protein [Propionivibrio soli]